MSKQVTELAVPVVKDLNLVAFSPGELASAQDQLRQWCEAMVKQLQTEQRDLRQNLNIAKRNKWRHSGFADAVRRTQKRVEFYAKIKVAIEAGYLIVPDFDVNVFAIRTAGRPKGEGEKRHDVPDQKAQELPVGAGRYVSPVPMLKGSDESYTETNSKGEVVPVGHWWASAFQDPEFPVRAVKPAILEATEAAMAARIFDRIGIVQKQRRKDPIVCGQIIHRQGYTEQVVNFFVAWWLDTRSLA